MLMLSVERLKDMSIFQFAKFEYYLNRAKFHPSSTHICPNLNVWVKSQLLQAESLEPESGDHS